MATRKSDLTPNHALFNARDARGETQEDVANGLTALAAKYGHASVIIQANHISRWERGYIERPSPLYRRLLAEYFGMSLAELGLTKPRAGQTATTTDTPPALPQPRPADAPPVRTRSRTCVRTSRRHGVRTSAYAA